MAKKAATPQAPDFKKQETVKLKKQRQLKPEDVVRRVMGVGKFQATRLLKKLGTDKAGQLVDLYEKKEGGAIRQMFSRLGEPEEPAKE